MFSSRSCNTFISVASFFLRKAKMCCHCFVCFELQWEMFWDGETKWTWETILLCLVLWRPQPKYCGLSFQKDEDKCLKNGRNRGNGFLEVIDKEKSWRICFSQEENTEGRAGFQSMESCDKQDMDRLLSEERSHLFLFQWVM